MQETGHLERCNSLFLILLILLIFSNQQFAQRFPDTVVDSLLSNGINYLVSENYSKAEHYFSRLYLQYPDLPLGEIYLAALKIAEAYDYAEEYDTELIENYLQSAESKSKKLIITDNENKWNHYLLGLSTGYYAYFQALRKNWLSAFSNGIDAVKIFNKCISIDSSFYDAYTAIGAYKFWSSHKTTSLHWLPFLSDDREEGINLLLRAVDSSSYNFHMASFSLLWVYIERKESENAINLSEKLLKSYPESRLFKSILARAYENIDKKKANEIYYELLKSITSDKRNNRYNEIVIKHKLAQNYVHLGNKEKAIQYCKELLSVNNIKSEIQKRLQERFKRIRLLYKELTE